MSIAIVLLWTMVVLGTALAILELRYFAVPGTVVLVATMMLAVYMAFVTRTWVIESNAIYELALDGDVVRLTTFDRGNRARTVQQLSLSEVTKAEFYEAKDIANLLLRAKSNDLDIPLWSFHETAQHEIVKYIQSRGIDIIGIPIDTIS